MLLGSNWLIKDGDNIQLVFAMNWKLACIKAFMIISREFWCKNIGEDTYRQEQHRNDPKGWFQPWVSDEEHGLTMSPERALGPDEIQKIMVGLARELKECDELGLIEEIWEKATMFFQRLPQSLVDKFSQLRDLSKTRALIKLGFCLACEQPSCICR